MVRGYGWDEPGVIMHGSTPKIVKTLIFINIGAFLLQLASGGGLDKVFGLCSHKYLQQVSNASPIFLIWQFFTYMFLHGGVWHLAINMFILWMFGKELEVMWGEKNFLRYYLACGVGGGIITYLFTMNSMVITIGASGAIFGILVAYAVIFPERSVTLLLFFFFPITMKAKHLVMIFAGIELLQCISGAQDGIGHFAHLGGALIGYIYLKIWRRSSYYSSGYGEGITSWLRKHLQRWNQKQEDNFEKEVDRILAKISKTGMQSLSRRERNMLRKKSMQK